MKYNKNTVLVPLILMSLAYNMPVSAMQESDPFAELDDEITNKKKAPSNELSSFEKFKESRLAEFKDWRQKHFDDYQVYREAYFKKLDDKRDKQIASWGEAEASTISKQVVYSEDNKTKTVIDYEKNEVRVSVISANNVESAEAKNKANDAIVNLVKQEEKNSAFINVFSDSKDINFLLSKSTHEPAFNIEKQQRLLTTEITKIHNQIKAQDNQVDRLLDFVSPTDPKPNDLVAEEKLIQEQKLKVRQEKDKRIKNLKATLAALKSNKQKRDKLANKKIITYTIPLKHQKALSKAQPFVDDVKKESQRWEGITLSLMLAIIHTESYFNPKAESHIPAYGLMQIVPRTAGIDVNRLLYKNDAPMTQEYLFNPESNIETGVAYVNILNSRYLRKITNPISRTYCIIAAYNTGSGNVARTFNKDKSRNITKASKIINAMSPEQVYNHLVNNLPYDETKHYVERVIKRRDIYKVLDEV